MYYQIERIASVRFQCVHTQFQKGILAGADSQIVVAVPDRDGLRVKVLFETSRIRF